jgi:hypothetical protein
MYPLLAQTDFENLFNILNIDPIRELWKLQWDFALNGKVYATLADVGRGFALLSLFISLIQFFRDASEESRSIDGRNRSVTEFIWPIIVVFLLSNQAKFLRDSTVGVRDAINGVNDTVLATNFKPGGQSLATQFENATREGAIQEQIGAVLNRCVGAADSGTQTNCVRNAGTLVDNIVSKYKPKGEPSPGFTQFVDNVKTALNEQENQENPDPTVLNTFITDADEAKQRREQLTQQVGFQNLIELTFLLTGLLAPLAVGLSILPVRAKPLYAWFAAFFAVGLTKIIFNFSLGVVASLLFGAKVLDFFLLSNLAGTFIPIGSAGLFLVLTTALYRVIDSIKVQT